MTCLVQGPCLRYVGADQVGDVAKQTAGDGAQRALEGHLGDAANDWGRHHNACDRRPAGQCSSMVKLVLDALCTATYWAHTSSL